ncbi:MAG: rhodanese-like domain-containing protein [Cyclobacteriaceae bacterium]|nr:rhodanese-like domain-containing protein [Cyclobacteriaceae bacterium]
MNIEQLILDGATIVDVRTPGEFAFGNAPGSKNIPLNEVPQRLEEFRNFKAPFVLCCQSGNRSGQATSYLQAQGIECFNAGSWFDVNYVLSKKSA